MPKEGQAEVTPVEDAAMSPGTCDDGSIRHPGEGALALSDARAHLHRAQIHLARTLRATRGEPHGGAHGAAADASRFASAA